MRRLFLVGAMLLRRTMSSITTTTVAASTALPSSYMLFRRHISRTSTVSAVERSEVIEFLSCSMSSKVAVSTANRVQIKTIEKAQSVIALFERFHFSKRQIESLVSAQPKVLNAYPDKTLMPKLRFFRRMKVSAADVAKAVSASPVMLHPALGTLETSVKLLRPVLRDDKTVLVAIKRYPGLLRRDLSDVLPANIQKLADEGVPVSTISALILTAPKSLVCPKRPFGEILAMIKEIGVDRSKPMFVHVFKVLADFTHPNWERKLAFYRGFGWSNDQIFYAFARFPYLMSISDEKIKKTVEFFKEKLGWGADKLCRSPTVMALNLEERTKPRCLVLETLASKGLLKGGITMHYLRLSEELFFQRFLFGYRERVPEFAAAMVPAKAS